MTAPPDPRVSLAAANNADLYQAVFRGHGLRFRRSDIAFVALDRPPPYYSQMTVLSPDDPEAILEEIDALAQRTESTVGLKDGFATLDLAACGFETMFDAQWIWRAPQRAQTEWQVVSTSAGLEQWEEAWKLGGSPTDVQMFPPDMLGDTTITFLAKWDGDQIVAGCIANLSPDCVGLSNIFGSIAFAAAAKAVGALYPSQPIVGYESGPDIEHARQAGFETIGPLRIWIMLKDRA